MPSEASEASGGRTRSLSSKNRMLMIAGGVVVAFGLVYVLFGRGGEKIPAGTTFIVER